ncbi:MAG: exodeoxyribonuclease VII small subunit [Anaerolineae bacterium]
MRKKQETFEQLFQELETTVEKLEAGNLALDESLALYERGMQLARQCGGQLDQAELRIKELSPGAVAELADEEADEEGGE